MTTDRLPEAGSRKDGTMERHEETRVVKAALKEAGLPVRRVSHGSGTGCGWLKITLVAPVSAAKEIEQALRIAQLVTGRCGDYDGRIQVDAYRTPIIARKDGHNDNR